MRLKSTLTIERMHHIIKFLGECNMYRAYKFRICPTSTQKVLIHKTFGCYRFIYKYFLEKCKNNGFYIAYDMCKELKEMNLG